MLPQTRRPLALATLAYLALTLAYTWPLPMRLMDGVAHDAGDPVLNAWIMWWTTKSVPLTAAWWNAPIFHPVPGALAFSEHLLGLAPIAAPLIALTGNALLGYNVTILASYVLSALGAHFLAFTLTRRHDAAFLAGVAFAFAPYRLAQLPHVQVLCAYWTPVCLAALHRYDRQSKPAWAAVAAFAWLMQALSNGYFLFFLSVLLSLWFVWFALGRWSLRSIAVAALAFTGAALLLAPILRDYQVILHDTYGFSRSADEIRLFSADVAGLLFAPDDLLLWGWVQVFRRPESSLFPGLAIVLLSAHAIYRARPFHLGPDASSRLRVGAGALGTILLLLLVAAAVPIAYGTWRISAAGLRVLSLSRADRPLLLAIVTAVALLLLLPRVRAAWRHRSALAFYLMAAAGMWILALGPEPTIMGRHTVSSAPYGWLMQLPGFDGLRVPARFWMMALACLSVVASLAVNPLAGRRRQAVIAIAAAGLLMDGWPRAFTVIAAPAARPAPPAVATRLDLPMSDDVDAAALYQQTLDFIPLHNGFSGYFAPHYYALRTLLDNRDPRVLHVLAADGPLGIVVHHELDQDGAIRRFVMAHPGVSVMRREPEWSSYLVPREAAPPVFPDRSGSPLQIKSLSTFPSPPHASRALDGDLRTRWSGGGQQQAGEAVIELEQVSHVGQVVIDLGGFVTDFPTRLQIDVSQDGTGWAPAWSGTTALHAYYAAVRHPREVPLVFAIDRDEVRFIRLRQTGFGSHDWSIAELHVLR